MKWGRTQGYLTSWQQWFAWHPVQFEEDFTWVWLEFIQHKGNKNTNAWEYRRFPHKEIG